MKREVTYNVKNLHCGGCAAKIEDAVGSLPYVESANLNFMKKTLLILLFAFLQGGIAFHCHVGVDVHSRSGGDEFTQYNIFFETKQIVSFAFDSRLGQRGIHLLAQAAGNLQMVVLSQRQSGKFGQLGLARL